MFKCQTDSFLQKFDTSVISVQTIDEDKREEVAKSLGIPNVTNEDKIYEIILENTILFPEGGGQPDDRGWINDVLVVRIIRRNHHAVHYVVLKKSKELDLKPDQKVSVKLDWPRRLDHMQQHSAQHLITAVSDGLFGFSTLSWWLGSEDSYIELDTPKISDAQLEEIEEKVNEKIRKNNSVSVEVVNLQDPKWKSVRTRGLPDDVQNEIRIVSIEGIDANVCCGTHVSSLSQLQVIKLLYSEKKKTNSLLHFIAGDRVLKKLTQSFQREQKLMTVLKTSVNDLVSSAEKITLQLKATKKSCSTLCKDLASLEANRFKTLDSNGMCPTGVLFFYHRENVDLDFGQTLLRELGDTNDRIILIVLKSEDNLGHILLRGGSGVISPELLGALGEEVCRVLDGKGTLRGNLYQAKFTKLNNFKKALKVANEYVEKFIVKK